VGGRKLQYSCLIAVLASFLPHKKFTWTDFWGYIYPYTPVATSLVEIVSSHIYIGRESVRGNCLVHIITIGLTIGAYMMNLGITTQEELHTLYIVQ